MNQNQDFKMQLLKQFGIYDQPKTIDFCREAYKFIMESDAPATAPETLVSSETIVVDLGLPSGTLWADRNIGAKSPEDFGLYFSWGNIEGHAMGSGYDFDDYNETKGHELDGDIDIEHDAARSNMGEPWQMPTKEQFQELVDNCTREWCCENGHMGSRFTSKINGKSVFFPAAGYGHATSIDNVGSYGLYWSRSLHSSDYGYSLYFNSSSVYPQHNNYRYYGFSVRAVQNCQQKKP